MLLACHCHLLHSPYRPLPYPAACNPLTAASASASSLERWHTKALMLNAFRAQELRRVSQRNAA